MTITIDPSAVAYIQKNKHDSVIIGTRRTGGWAGGIVPFVEMGKANEADGWLSSQVEGITVYYRPGLRTYDQTVRITTFGPWIFKKLHVTGILI